MENNIFTLFFLPEFILTLGTIVLLLLGLFLKKNVFSIISNLSVLLLILVGFLIYYNKKIELFYFLNFFKESYFISFFQTLVIFGSI